MKTKTPKRCLKFDILLVFLFYFTGKRRQTSDFDSVFLLPHPWISKRRISSALMATRVPLAEDRRLFFPSMHNNQSSLIRKAVKNSVTMETRFWVSLTFNASSWFNPHKRIIVVDSLFTDSNKSNHHFSRSFSPRKANNDTKEERKSTHTVDLSDIVPSMVHVFCCCCYKS